MNAADLEVLSNNALASAAVVFFLAFVAHIWEWAQARSLPEAGRTRKSVLVGVDVGSRRTASAVAVPSGAHGGTGSVDEKKALKVDIYGRIGIALTVLAGLLNFVAVLTRGLAAERVPWGNMYEFATAGTFAFTAVYLLLLRRYELRWLGPVVSGVAVAVLMLAVLILHEPVAPLVPSLHSYWLVIHVIAAVMATGAFTVGAMASALFLIKKRAEGRETPGATGYIARLPHSSVLDRVAFRVHAFGFPIWTFAALIAGPIWAQYAWGRYWGWDPKEVWAFITWVIYAAYLHARSTAGWKGKAAVISLVGMATLLFNFIGINYFFGAGSLHSYA